MRFPGIVIKESTVCAVNLWIWEYIAHVNTFAVIVMLMVDKKQ